MRTTVTALPRLITRARKRVLMQTIANGILQAAIAFAGSMLVKYAFDHLVRRGSATDMAAFVLIASALAATALLAAWTRVTAQVLAERLGQSYAFDIRLVLYDRLTELPARALQGRSRGSVMLRFVGDLTSVRKWVSLGLARVIITGFSVVGAVLALTFISWPLAVTVVLTSSLGVVAMLPLGNRLRNATRESRRRLARLAANINEKVATISVVQVFGQSSRERHRVENQGARLRDAMIEKAKASGLLRAVMDVSAAFAHGAVLLVGALEVSAQRATPGTVVAAMIVVGILLPQLRDLGRVQTYWQGAALSLQKIAAFLEFPSPLLKDAPAAPDLLPGAGRLEFVDVKIPGALHGISVIAAPRSVVAIVGPNGAGKSTLLALAARLIDPTEGEVLLDDQALAEHNLASVRRAIGIVGPDLPLLRGTIASNLRYRWPAAPAAEMRRVMTLCELDEVLAELPNGEQTKIAEAGIGVSVGQRQRIALARALVGDPPLLLLDEAEATLDQQALRVIDRLLAQHRGTALIITHRLERILLADAVWYLEGGRLLEAGPPRVVLAANGPTARLFALQQHPEVA